MFMRGAASITIYANDGEKRKSQRWYGPWKDKTLPQKHVILLSDIQHKITSIGWKHEYIVYKADFDIDEPTDEIFTLPHGYRIDCYSTSNPRNCKRISSYDGVNVFLTNLNDYLSGARPTIRRKQCYTHRQWIVILLLANQPKKIPMLRLY